MLLKDLIAHARTIARDVREPFQWKDPELRTYANQAEHEACRRSRLLLDSQTDDMGDGVEDDPDTVGTDETVIATPVCLYPVTAGTKWLELHPRILFVREVQVASQELPLPPMDRRDVGLRLPGWQNHEDGVPILWVPNLQPKKIRFYPGFAADDEVRLTVVRLPLADMADPDADEPEIEERHHLGLVNWMLARMFEKPDPDTQDMKRAAFYDAKFEEEFGPRSRAIDEEWINQNHGYDGHEGLF